MKRASSPTPPISADRSRPRPRRPAPAGQPGPQPPLSAQPHEVESGHVGRHAAPMTRVAVLPCNGKRDPGIVGSVTSAPDHDARLVPAAATDGKTAALLPHPPHPRDSRLAQRLLRNTEEGVAADPRASGD